MRTAFLLPAAWYSSPRSISQRDRSTARPSRTRVVFTSDPAARMRMAGVIIAETIVRDEPPVSCVSIAGRLANAPGRPCAR